MRLMIGRAVLCVLVVAASARAEWKRVLSVGMGEQVDSPLVHPLVYFRVHPCLRVDLKDRITECMASRTPELTDRIQRTRTELYEVGKIGALRVYDLEYFTGEKESILGEKARGPDMRSVLVEAGPGRFHEILAESNWLYGTIYRARVVEIDHQPCIAVKSDDGGNYHFVTEYYFCVADGVPTRLDFDPVIRAALKAVPDDEEAWQPTTDCGVDTLVYSVATEKKERTVGPKVSCCVGTIEVPFWLQDGRVVPGIARYYAGWPQH
jgi:hypothetical protein